MIDGKVGKLIGDVVFSSITIDGDAASDVLFSTYNPNSISVFDVHCCSYWNTFWFQWTYFLLLAELDMDNHCLLHLLLYCWLASSQHHQLHIFVILFSSSWCYQELNHIHQIIFFSSFQFVWQWWEFHSYFFDCVGNRFDQISTSLYRVQVPEPWCFVQKLRGEFFSSLSFPLLCTYVRSLQQKML